MSSEIRWTCPGSPGMQDLLEQRSVVPVVGGGHHKVCDALWVGPPTGTVSVEHGPWGQLCGGGITRLLGTLSASVCLACRAPEWGSDALAHGAGGGAEHTELTFIQEKQSGCSTKAPAEEGSNSLTVYSTDWFLESNQPCISRMSHLALV